MLPQEILKRRSSEIAGNIYFASYICIVNALKEGNHIPTALAYSVHKAESPLGGKMSRYEKLNQSLLFAARIFRCDSFEQPMREQEIFPPSGDSASEYTFDTSGPSQGGHGVANATTGQQDTSILPPLGMFCSLLYCCLIAVTQESSPEILVELKLLRTTMKSMMTLFIYLSKLGLCDVLEQGVSNLRPAGHLRPVD